MRIPDYQRGYAWEQSQISDFLEDLELLGPGKGHYTGTLILDPTASEGQDQAEEDTGATFRRVDVVDGQQRLTTIVILLAAISRELRRLGNSTLSDGIRKTFVVTKTIHDQPLLKLRPNHDNANFWERAVIPDVPAPDPPAITSHRRLLQAREQIEAYFGRKSSEMKEEYAAWLRRLREKVVLQLRVTVYEVDDSAEVGVIFETQNDRGRPLTDLEKTKNLLLYLAAKIEISSHGLPGLINSTWTRLLTQLSNRDLGRPEDENALLRCHWLIHYHAAPRDWHGFETVKTRFSLRRYQGRHDTLANEIREYLNTLSDCIVPYIDVLVPDYSRAYSRWHSERLHQEIVTYGNKLRRIGSIANLIPLLVAMQLRPDFTAENYRDVLVRCEIFSFRTAAVGSRSDAGQRLLFPLARRIVGGDARFHEILRTLREVTNEFARSVLVHAKFELIEDWYRWKLLKYVLLEYEIQLSGPSHPPALPWQTVEGRTVEQTIEHILPQSATNPYWNARFTRSQVQQLTHDLGNLCLTYDNATYRNKGFDAKKGSNDQESPCYARSPLFQERDLCRFTEWTPQTIAERRRALFDFVWTRWEIEPIARALVSATIEALPRDDLDADNGDNEN